MNGGGHVMNGGGHVMRSCDEWWRSCDEWWRSCDEWWRSCDLAHTKHGQVDGVGVFEVSKHSLAGFVS